MVPDRSILVRPLESIPNDGRECLGIHQSDIILRTAIIAGIADLRANPDILDYVFASLPKDPLTFRDYGEQNVAAAKEWFLNTDIPVMMNTRVDENKVPCVTITLLSSQEDVASLGDVHYQTTQPGPDKITTIVDRFSPTSYSASTGECVVPVSLDNVFPGMQLLDSKGKRHTIREVWDDRIILDAGLTSDFRNCKIVSAKSTVVSLESLAFKEGFTVACHAPSEPVYLTYLHSIVSFILLRYKEELIEARGLERTTISSGEVYLNTSFPGQIVFTRPITVYGYVRNYWPKVIRQPIQGITVGVTVGETTTGTTFQNESVAASGGVWGVTDSSVSPANATSIVLGSAAPVAAMTQFGVVRTLTAPYDASNPIVPVVDPTGNVLANGLIASAASGADAITLLQGARIQLGGGNYIDSTSTVVRTSGAFYAGVSGSSSVYCGVIVPGPSTSMQILGRAVDGASAIAVKVENVNSLTTTGAKIISFYSDQGITEKASIDKDGTVYTGGTLRATNITSLSTSASMVVRGNQADGASAIGVVLNTNSTYSTAGSKLVSFQNFNSEKAYVRYNGDFVTSGTLFVNAWQPYAAVGISLSGGVADGASAIGVTINNTTSLTTLGAKLISIQNAGVEKAYFDKDGGLYAGSTIRGGASVTSANGNFQHGGTGTVSLTGTASDSGTAVATILNSNTSLTTTGAKIASFRNAGSEKAYIDKDGVIYAGSSTGSPGGGIIYTAALSNLANNPVTILGRPTNNNTAIAVKLCSINTLTTAGAKIAAFYNDNGTTQVASIDKDGSGYFNKVFANGVELTPGGSPTPTITDISRTNEVVDVVSVWDATHTTKRSETTITRTSGQVSQTVTVDNVLGKTITRTITRTNGKITSITTTVV